MNRPLPGKSQLCLPSPVSDPSSPVPQPLKAPTVQPLPRHWGFKQGKMDLEGPQPTLHTSLLCIPHHYSSRCLLSLPASSLSPSLFFYVLFLLLTATLHGCKKDINIWRREPHLLKQTDVKGCDRRSHHFRSMTAIYLLSEGW